MNNNIDYKVIKVGELNEYSLDQFERYQKTTKVWYGKGTLVSNYNIKESQFVDEWDLEAKREIAKYLIECMKRGGCVVAACEGEQVIGFANLEAELFDEDKYIELPFMHVSAPYRGNKIGKVLFKMCIEAAKGKGAKKIYIGAHPSIEAQAFYQSVGVTYAKQVNEEIYNREPLDLQMEYVL